MRIHLALVAALGLVIASAAPAHATIPNLPTCPSCTDDPFDLGDPSIWMWILAFRW